MRYWRQRFFFTRAEFRWPLSWGNKIQTHAKFNLLRHKNRLFAIKCVETRKGLSARPGLWKSSKRVIMAILLLFLSIMTGFSNSVFLKIQTGGLCLGDEDDELISTEQTCNVRQCAIQCYQDQECSAFTFIGNNSTCLLHRDLRAEDVPWLMLNKQVWQGNCLLFVRFEDSVEVSTTRSSTSTTSPATTTDCDRSKNGECKNTPRHKNWFFSDKEYSTNTYCSNNNCNKRSKQKSSLSDLLMN